MERGVISDSHLELDDVSDEGVFFCYDDTDKPYDVRKAAAYFHELMLRPGDELPEEYKKLCLL